MPRLQCCSSRVWLNTQELGRLDDSTAVYKLIGPAMIKQDLAEANVNVSKRLEYIQGEVKRITGKLAELEAKSKEQQQLVRGLACMCYVGWLQEGQGAAERVGNVF